MATIKLSDGKVVLKDGKASCECCGGCCMYPAKPTPLGDLLIAEDLPDAITLLGVGSLSRSGTSYGDTTNGVIFETDTWAKYVGGVRTTQACLIGGDGNLTPGDNAVEDQFAATYIIRLVDYDEVLEEVLVHRVSLCRWENEWSGFLRFNPYDIGWSCFGGLFGEEPGAPEYGWGGRMEKRSFCGHRANSPIGPYWLSDCRVFERYFEVISA